MTMSVVVYIWHKLTNKNINLKNVKLYIVLILLSIISVLNYYIVIKYLRIITITLFLILSYLYLFKEKLNKSIFTPLYTQFIFMLSETIAILFIVTVLKLDVNELTGQFLGNFIVNRLIDTTALLIIKVSITKKLFNLILFNLEKINKKIFAILSLFLISIANILTATTYYKLDIRVMIIINAIFTLFCLLIVLHSFKMQNSYNKVSNKYNIAINSLKDYEEMMTQYRISNHENKNLLLTIRAMILNKEKNITKYIDSIVEEKYEDDENLLFKMSVIPSGGLRATIYSEILKIKKNKINYILHFDNELSTIDLIELDENTIIDICKIIGVFIDNAIEEVKSFRAKNKNIQIHLYIEENKINIKISNTYKNKIEIDKIYEEGYTTKGAGHGHGLTLVKNIVDRNNVFSNYIEMDKALFSQVLSIKYKKSH